MIQWQINVEPRIGQRRPRLLFDRDSGNIFGPICGNKLPLRRNIADEDSLVEFRYGLAQPLESRIRLYPGKAIANSILVIRRAQRMGIGTVEKCTLDV